LNRRGDPIGPPEAGRYMADRIPGSRFVELVGDHVMWLGDIESLCGEIQEFITGLRPEAREPASVVTIMQWDIEGSTPPGPVSWVTSGGRTSSHAMAELPMWRSPLTGAALSIAPATGSWRSFPAPWPRFGRPSGFNGRF